MKPSVAQGMKLQKFKKTLVSKMVMSEKTILTQGHELLLNAVQLFGVSSRYRVT
jgi:hypothetical protein